MDFVLRPWRESDAPDIAIAANDYEVAKNLRNVFPYPYTLEDAQFFIRDCIAKGDSCQITRTIEVEGKAAGSIGIFLGNDIYEKSAELGYWLAKPYWRQGIMSCAARQLCGEAFAAFDLLRIYAEPFADNLGSRGVLEKAGFTLEGIMRNGVYKNGEVKSYCMYALLREEWEKADKPVLSSSFTIEDIHRLREYNYERTKNLPAEERQCYYNDAGMEIHHMLQERKSSCKGEE